MEQHFTDLERVFARLKAANLKVSENKMKLAKGTVLVLGHILVAADILPNPNHIQGLAKMTRPWCSKETTVCCGREHLPKVQPSCSTLGERLLP